MIARVAPMQDAGSPSKWQFGVSSLLWLMATIGMCLAFARPFGMSAMTLVLVAPLFAILVGSLLARGGGRQQAIYWAVVCATLGALCVIPARVDPLTFVFWPFIGAIAGAYCGARLPRVTVGVTSKAIFVGFLFVGLYSLPLRTSRYEFLLDLACAPAVCLSLSVLIRTIEWLRTKYGTPREIWAAGLIFAVIMGNLAAAAMTGGRFQ